MRRSQFVAAAVLGVAGITIPQSLPLRAPVAILKRTKAADIPGEQGSIFDVGVNLDMAKKIGITIPQSILAQATLVIDYDIRAPQPPGAK